MNYRFFASILTFFAFTIFLPFANCAIASTSDELRNLAVNQAELVSRIQDMQNTIAQLTGRVEDLEFKLKGQTQQIEKQLSLVSSRVKPPEGVNEEWLVNDEEALKMNNSESGKLYKSALSALRTGDFAVAIQSFDAFTKRYPNTAYTDNALYWAGLSAELMGDYDQAVVYLSEAYQKFPAEDFAPIALFQIANCFQKSGNYTNQKLMLQKLIDDYPKSAQAKEASNKLKNKK